MARKAPEQLVEESDQAPIEIKLAKVSGEAAALKKQNKKIIASAVESEKRLDALMGIQGDPAMVRFEKMPRSASLKKEFSRTQSTERIHSI